MSLVIAAGCADGGGGRDSASAGLSAGGWTSLPSATTLTTSESSGGADVSTGAGTTDESTSSSSGGAPGSSTSQGDGGEVSTGAAITSGASSGEGVPKFDLGTEPDAMPPAESKACVKVDLLFVIDDSGSMKEEQATLVAGFPTFVQEIKQELADAESLHIGVVTTDAYAYNSAPCANTLGALVTQTGGQDASGAACGPYASGKRFMNEKDNLAQTFACAAQVGTDGDGDEKPVDAALYALGAGLGAPGACNEEFVRDDALLVLVLITDEEEEGSVGDPPQWFNSLVALKGGIETNIVLLSLFGTEDPLCPDAYEVGHRLQQFTKMFTYGSVGQICAPSYQQFFHDAIAGIAEACDNFTPPG